MTYAAKKIVAKELDSTTVIRITKFAGLPFRWRTHPVRGGISEIFRLGSMMYEFEKPSFNTQLSPREEAKWFYGRRARILLSMKNGNLIYIEEDMGIEITTAVD